MKEKVIEVAGKTWRFLGQNGETDLNNLCRYVKEKEAVVFQALGWLAREDKINYTTKNRKTFVSLVEIELKSFNNLVYHMDSQQSSISEKESVRNNRLKSLK